MPVFYSLHVEKAFRKIKRGERLMVKIADIIEYCLIGGFGAFAFFLILSIVYSLGGM